MDWDRCAEITEKIRSDSAGKSFLSEIILKDDDLDFICTNALDILFPKILQPNILTAYLMVYAGRDYDGSYWPHLENLLGVTTSQKDREFLMIWFYDGLRELGLNKENVKTPRNIEKILMHTVVPDKEEYMNNFFSFVCSFYKDVLNFELPEDYHEAFELLSAIVKEEIKNDQLPSPYALNKCTVYALSDPENYDKIMIKILNIIDAGYKGRKITDLGNNRFAIPFQKWYMDNIGSRSRSSLRKEIELRRARIVLSSEKVKIHIPAMKCTCNASIVVKIGRKPIKEILIKTFPIKTQGSIIYKMINDVVLDPKELGIDPFSKFQIELDGRVLLSHPSEDVILFNEDQTRIKSPNIGINYILVKNPDIVPTCESSSIDKITHGLYASDLKEGDEITVGESHFSVMPSDSVSEGINITPLENVTAITDMEILPVCTEFDLLCLATNANVLSKLYISIRLDDDCTYHRSLNVSPNNVNGGIYVSRLLKDEHTSSGIHTVFVELYHNNKKVGDSKFVLLPEYKFEFDKNPAYINEIEGTLSYSGPIDGSINFQTTDEYVDVPIPDSIIKLRHKVPSLRIRTGDNIWRSPGQYDLNILDFIGDYLWVSSPCASLVLFQKKPVPRHRSDNYDVYDFHKIHEMYNSENVKNIELEISLESKPRFHLCNIWVCNDYSIKIKKETMELSVVKHTDNKVSVYIPETKETMDFDNDILIIKKPECNGYSIVINEKDQYGTEHVLFNQKYYKKEIYVEKMTNTSCTIFCYDESVELHYNNMDLKSIMNSYDASTRFLVNMKNTRPKVMAYLKSIGIK